MCLSRFPARPNDFSHYEQTFIFVGKHSTISSLGLAWIGKTQLSTEVFLKLSLNSAQTFKDVELVALLNATFRYQVHSRW